MSQPAFYLTHRGALLSRFNRFSKIRVDDYLEFQCVTALNAGGGAAVLPRVADLFVIAQRLIASANLLAWLRFASSPAATAAPHGDSTPPLITHTRQAVHRYDRSQRCQSTRAHAPLFECCTSEQTDPSDPARRAESDSSSHRSRTDSFEAIHSLTRRSPSRTPTNSNEGRVIDDRCPITPSSPRVKSAHELE